ncbi:MAG TPA: lysophospholipid acyltransferase family protein [Geobacteraceae bacterium]|nr:lysophospholipid acyltransferase family protein [Geobacteraceae bacterium]
MIRACLYLLFFVPWTFFCASLALLSTFIDTSGRTYHRFALLWSRVGLLCAGVQLEVEGAELIPHDRPLIFMGNHQSNFDIMTLFLAVPVRFNWLAKEELFRVPVFGHSMKRAGYIPINRGDGRDALKSLDRAAKLIRAGTSVAVFPEGTRSTDGKLLPFKKGGFILAAKAGVTIIPFTIIGSREINPPDNFLSLHPGKIRVRFSHPLSSGNQGAKQQAQLMEQVREAIAAGLES